MRVLDPGHYFALNCLDTTVDDFEETLRFVKREGPGYPGNVGHYSGTTMQEVLRALISRAMYVNNQIQDGDTEKAIYHMTQAVYHFEARAALRHSRPVDFTPTEAVTEPTCVKCGHVHCYGNCSEQHNNEVLYIPIVINGKELDIENHSVLTYDDIVALVLNNDLVSSDAKVSAAFGSSFAITVWSWDNKVSGLIKNESVTIQPGMKFTAVIGAY
jgi:hypothetical protein